MKRLIMQWDKAEALKKGNGKPVKLVRADGSADLAIDPNGQLRRLSKKPEGKAERKRWKAARRAAREQTQSNASN